MEIAHNDGQLANPTVRKLQQTSKVPNGNTYAANRVKVSASSEVVNDATSVLSVRLSGRPRTF